MEQQKKKISLIPLILMIFTSVFGFANMPRAFYLMGYGAIIWFIFSTIVFFIPYAFMMAEYGAAFKNEKGGIYSWMNRSIGPKFAFAGTFMLYASNLIWMVNSATGIWIPFSNTFFGADTTQNWNFNISFGSISLNIGSVQIIGILAIAWILLVTYIASKGLDKITKITSIGGLAVALLNVVLLVGAIIVLIYNHGKLAQPLTSVQKFVKSPNPSYQSGIAMLSFLVFAIFGYGGIEMTGGLVDETENAEVTFPKGVTISAIIISVGYALGIFACGIFINWGNILSDKSINMANVCYVIMQNLGVQIGLSMGLSQGVTMALGAWMARITGLSMFLALSGAFLTVVYSPLKQLIEGTPKEIWPNRLTQIKDNMPKYAMKVQAIIVVFIIALISFGGDGASAFFNKLVLMTNVAVTFPYLFLSFAFIYFKKNDDIEKPFVFFKTKKSGIAAGLIATIAIAFANLFTIIEPSITSKDYSSTIWMVSGPLAFIVIALLMYRRYEKNEEKNACIDINKEEAC